MDFWDVNRKKVMGSTSSHCAVAYGWSPDSRWFLTATCAPRMNVDNDVKVGWSSGSFTHGRRKAPFGYGAADASAENVSTQQWRISALR